MGTTPITLLSLIQPLWDWEKEIEGEVGWIVIVNLAYGYSEFALPWIPDCISLPAWPSLRNACHHHQLRRASYSPKSGDMGWGLTLATQAFDLDRQSTWMDLSASSGSNGDQVLQLQTARLVPFPWLTTADQWADQGLGFCILECCKGCFLVWFIYSKNVSGWHADRLGEGDASVLSQEAPSEPPSPQRYLPFWAHSLSHPRGSCVLPWEGRHSLYPLSCYFLVGCSFSSYEQLQVKDMCVFLCLTITQWLDVDNTQKLWEWASRWGLWSA